MTATVKQEVSEMLGGRISNQDEDEVEEELAALEAELAPPAKKAAAPQEQQSLPNVPDTQLPVPSREEQTTEATKQRQQQPERQAMLA